LCGVVHSTPGGRTRSGATDFLPKVRERGFLALSLQPNTHTYTHTQSRQPQGWGGVCEPAVEEDRVSLSHCVCLVLVLTVPLYTCVRQRVLLLSQSVAGASTHVDTRSSLFFSSSPIGFLTNLELISRNNSPLRVGVCWRRLWRLVGFLVRRRLHAKAERGVYHAVRGVVVVVVVERYR
jgi:hypothetical protein